MLSGLHSPSTPTSNTTVSTGATPTGTAMGTMPAAASPKRAVSNLRSGQGQPQSTLSSGGGSRRQAASLFPTSQQQGEQTTTKTPTAQGGRIAALAAARK